MLNLNRTSFHFSVAELIVLLLCLAPTRDLSAQNKPLRHIYIGVSSVSMGNIII